MTKVTFKIEKPTTRGERTPFAYFPDEVWDLDGNRACYAHVGQHGACAWNTRGNAALRSMRNTSPSMTSL